MTNCRPNQIAQRRNCLLSAVVIVTTCGDSLAQEADGVGEFGELLAENISIPELSVMVAECTRTLLVATAHTVVGKSLAESVVPPLVSLATECGEYSDDGDQEKNAEVSIVPKLVNDVLVGFALSMKGEQASAGLSLVLPTLIRFLVDERNGVPEPQRRAYVNQKLVELASRHGESFRTVVQSGLSAYQREVLEKTLTGNQATPSEVGLPAENAPKTHIELKSFH